MTNARRWFVHLGLFGVGQVILLVIGQSWLAGVLFGDLAVTSSSPLSLLNGGESESLPLMMNLGRLWCIVFVVDTVWTLFSAMSPKKQKR